MSDQQNGSEEEEKTTISWSPILVTLLFSVLQGIGFLAFFLIQRWRDKKENDYDLYEPRQHTRSHRTPKPFSAGLGPFGWAWDAYKVPSNELLRCVGLDSYMFLRFLRLSARMTFVGTLLSAILLPIYSFGSARGEDTVQFNRITMARVDQNSPRLWSTIIAWYAFIAFLLYDLWTEWKLYAVHRRDFLATGDVDTPSAFKYTVRVENLPEDLRSNAALRAYFERLFPNQIRQVFVCVHAKKLDELIAERQECIESLEVAIAQTKAHPEDKAPKTKTNKNKCGCGGKKVDAIPYYEGEIERLNREVDRERKGVYAMASDRSTLTEGSDQQGSNSKYGSIRSEEKSKEEAEAEADGEPSTTGYVTLTSLKAKQAAAQCNLSGSRDEVNVFPVAEPDGVIWENVAMNMQYQRVFSLLMAAAWITGILFWAFPVSIVSSLSNLNGVLTGIGLAPLNEDSFLFGVLSGLLPVVLLALLMKFLYMALVVGATSVIRKKSSTEVQAYTLYWHVLFQYANLWLILIGGSLFNQLAPLINDPTSIIGEVAKAIPATSVFFVNKIIGDSFASFGLELSMLPTYGITLLKKVLKPEAERTQRMIDNAKIPPSIEWGKVIPDMIFIYLVAILYMPIVPIIEVFALAFFAGSYIVWKHQCLHVYAAHCEGGGDSTWEQLFGFLMGAIYMSEVVFIAYMGIMEAPIQAGLGFVPLIVTVILHMAINRNIRQPLETLCLRVAAEVDEREGELSLENDVASFEEAVERLLYAQPSLKPSEDERGPLPYRRSEEADVEEGSTKK